MSVNPNSLNKNILAQSSLNKPVNLQKSTPVETQIKDTVSFSKNKPVEEKPEKAYNKLLAIGAGALALISGVIYFYKNHRTSKAANKEIKQVVKEIKPIVQESQESPSRIKSAEEREINSIKANLQNTEDRIKNGQEARNLLLAEAKKYINQDVRDFYNNLRKITLEEIKYEKRPLESGSPEADQFYSKQLKCMYLLGLSNELQICKGGNAEFARSAATKIKTLFGTEPDELINKMKKSKNLKSLDSIFTAFQEELKYFDKVRMPGHPDYNYALTHDPHNLIMMFRRDDKVIIKNKLSLQSLIPFESTTQEQKANINSYNINIKERKRYSELLNSYTTAKT
ncbi:MAG: hypothetical protein WCG23_00070 [bacterium]